MKRKTISAIISRKFDEWTNTIDDKILRDRVRANTICTGGSIASMLLGEPINDFDFYFRDYETALAVAYYYVAKFKSATGNTLARDRREAIHVVTDGTRIAIKVKSSGVANESNTEGYQYFESVPEEDRARIVDFVDRVTKTTPEAKAEAKDRSDEDENGKPKYRPVFLSGNAISLSHKVQLVIRFYGEPDQIHETYDFIHCQNYWDSAHRFVTLRPDAMEALLTRELRYNGSKYPLCSLFRMRKFIERGWHCNAGTILKIAWNLQQFDLNDIAVLEDQLTGVDVSYFNELIEKLRTKDSAAVDGTYLAQLIDRMF